MMQAAPPLLGVFPNEERLLLAAGQSMSPTELDAARKLMASGLPPVTSLQSLSLLMGVSTQFLGAMLRNPSRFYRTFEIRSGTRTRRIRTPKVGLKIIQRWFSQHMSRALAFANHVHGFVPGRSTVTAARQHCPATWVLTVDIRDFFGSVESGQVFSCLIDLGYPRAGAHVMTDLCTLERALPQGAPSSPVLANLVFRETDKKLEVFATDQRLQVTRYADDISVSGQNSPDSDLVIQLAELIESDGWVIARNKTRLVKLPQRHPLVLGLLVDQGSPRLPKSYRNRLRMMRHMLNTPYLTEPDRAKFLGHIAYAESVR